MFSLLLEAVKHYRLRHDFEESEAALHVITTCFQGLPHLKHIVIRDSREGGILKSAPDIPPPLVEFQKFFPLSQASFDMLLGTGAPDESPLNGYLNITAALGALKKPIESLLVYPNSGLFHFGMPLIDNDIKHKVKTDAQYRLQPPAHYSECGISQVKRLHLSINIPFPEAENSANAKAMAHTFRDLRLLRISTLLLENLSLSFDVATVRNSYATESFFDVLPLLNSFPKLHTLELSRFTFTTPSQLTQFLIMQPSLRHLSLVECVIRNGKWHDVLHLLASASAFRLDSVNLYRPRDDENYEHEVDWNDSFIPSIVSNKLILNFINGKDTINRYNPFHKSQRVWRVEDGRRYKELIEEAQSSFQSSSNPNEDVGFEDDSDWEPDDKKDVEQWCWREEEDMDFDGPEYDTEYDFSAEEESDSDDEGVIWGEHEWLPKPRQLLGKRARDDDDDEDDAEEADRLHKQMKNLISATTPDGNKTEFEFDARQPLKLGVWVENNSLRCDVKFDSVHISGHDLVFGAVKGIRIRQAKDSGRPGVIVVHLQLWNGEKETYDVKETEKTTFVVCPFNCTTDGRRRSDGTICNHHTVPDGMATQVVIDLTKDEELQNGNEIVDLTSEAEEEMPGKIFINSVAVRPFETSFRFKPTSSTPSTANAPAN